MEITKIKKIQQVEITFVGSDQSLWFWIEPFTDFDDKWIWAFDGKADEFTILYRINTSNITYVYFKNNFKTFYPKD